MSVVDEMLKKKELIGEKLQQRENERLAQLEKRDVNREANKSENEQLELFEHTLNSEKLKIENELEEVESMEKAEATDIIDALTTRVHKLQKYVADSTIFLPSYNIRKAQSTVNGLALLVKSTREKMQPVKKFAFKKKKKTVNEVVKSQPHVMNVGKKLVNIASSDVGFCNISGGSLTMSADESAAKDVVLNNLKDSMIKLYGSPSTVHVTNLDNCTILVGSVSTSVYFDNCKACTIAVSCQQLRIHQTYDSKFYVDVNTKPIIEDCKNVGFAPYSWACDGTPQTVAKNWNDVADFNWLSSDKPSPNWFLIDVDSRQKFID